MIRRVFEVAALLLLACTMPLSAQEAAPQAFLAPPRLAEKIPFSDRLVLAPALTTGCKPDGDITRNGNLVNLHLVAKVAPNQINNPGANGNKDNVRLRSYGGCLTGPAIEAKPGNTLRLFLDNSLDVNDPSCPAGAHAGPGCYNTINMHFHGLHVSPAGNSDNVLLNIGPHTKFEYEINIPVDHPSGTFWYHPHRHGSTALQVASGASGALIVRGDRRYTGNAPGDVDTVLRDAGGNPLPEQIFLFQQIAYSCFDASGNISVNADKTWKCAAGQTGVIENFGKQLASATVWDTSGRFTSINGAVQPALTGIGAGEVQRWRFIHAGIHDTVNVQIVPMVTTGPKAALALRGILAGTPREQEETVKQLCPAIVPDGSKQVELVPQFEIAADGLTRSRIKPIGASQQSVSGGIGSNFLQPGYRSDVLVAFPKAGTYCMLNQAATPDERPHGGQGPNVTQLLATVIVSGGKPVVGDLGEFVRNTLYEGNKNDASLPKEALDGLKLGDLTPWRGMPEVGPASNSANPRAVAFWIGNLPDPGHPTDPKGGFGFWLNQKEYDPDRVDQTVQVGSTEDWVLASYGEPHIFHIHVNPFEIMDVTYKGTSIFDSNGTCLVPKDSLGLQNQYCNMWHTFKDTVFVQNDYQVHVRTTYDRYIGEFVIHCHILDHEDSGMMANILVVPDIAAEGGGLGMPGMKTMSNGTTTQEIHRH